MTDWSPCARAEWTAESSHLLVSCGFSWSDQSLFIPYLATHLPGPGSVRDVGPMETRLPGYIGRSCGQQTKERKKEPQAGELWGTQNCCKGNGEVGGTQVKKS